jgi:hypothetical protein
LQIGRRRMADINIKINDDRNTVRLTMIGGTETVLDVPALEQHIRELSYRRQAMLPTPPIERDPDDAMVAVTDPVCRVLPGNPGELVVLDVRHPGFGWLRFALHPDKAAELAVGLVRPIEL